MCESWACVDGESQRMLKTFSCDLFCIIVNLMDISEILSVCVKALCIHKGQMFASADLCVYVGVFRCLLTSSGASLAALASFSARRVQQAHFRHLDTRSSFSYQLPGSLSQLSAPLCIPLLHTQNMNKNMNKRISVTRVQANVIRDPEKES